MEELWSDENQVSIPEDEEVLERMVGRVTQPCGCI